MHLVAKFCFASVLLSCGLGVVDGRSLWSSQPATHGPKGSDEYILKTSYPVGNGRLGAMPFGAPGKESLALNIDSFWSGGPFESTSYLGGNPSSAKATALPDIRSWIFDHGTGNVSDLLGSGANYGSYRALGNLTIGIDHGGGSYKGYKRSLDLETAMHKTSYEVDDAEFTTTTFCSFPGDVCVYRIDSTKPLPDVTAGFENTLVAVDTVNASCSQRQARFTGVTQLGPPVGMKFDAIARVVGGKAKTSCDDGVLTITPANGAKSVTLVIGAGTDFDQSHGTAEYDYSFRGEDPAALVEEVTSAAAVKCYKDIVSDHLADYKALFGAFTLDLPDTKGSGDKETSEIVSGYSTDGNGDPFVEALLFDYSRYMLITSSRENSLPANLQGRWTEENNPAWSADYHANINLQMNYWAADQTGLAKTQIALWKYMAENWAPRGAETAELLYGGKGWVVHNEMNIFGHTGMKDGTGWANYPAAAAWMMQHVWDNFDYTQDVDWLRSDGYPLLKGIAEFWLSQLQKDEFFNDGTLVVNPCNSPEHGPTTFGCTHYQQLIFQVFEATLTSGAILSETDTEFTKQLTDAIESLDTGLHFTEWGGIKEWKLPDSFGYDAKNTHRHLSNLVGWHPGYSISSFENGYTNSTIQGAIEETLKARGNGNAADANSGWAKVWRSACWARLNNTEQAHYELRYAIDLNFANNGFSMYNGLNAPFQIDANFGLGGAVLSMLVVDLPQRHGATGEARTVVLGPAIPPSWGGGSVKGLRLRGGSSVDFSWDDTGKVKEATLSVNGKDVTLVNVDGEVVA